MKDDPLPDADHVVRYVRSGLIDGEEVAGGAFLRRNGERACSINWLDYFRDQSKERQVREVRRLIRLEIRPNGRLAELHVGRTKQHVADHLTPLDFVEDPLAADLGNGYRENPSHALIKGLPDPEQNSEFSEMIGDMIAECVIIPLHKAIEG